MARKQELMDGWEQDARDLAKAERELQIEHWVQITFGFVDDNRETVTLHVYDLPRKMLDRYLWVIRWRRARLQCLHPRRMIASWYSHYDKRTGLITDFGSCLGRLASGKAQVTKARRCIEQHITDRRARYPLFYDESTDTELVKYREKLGRKIENLRLMEENIRLAVENEYSAKIED